MKIKLLLDIYRRYKDPEKYWKSKGLKIGDNCSVHSSAYFGSEPYLISIGDHVRINANVNFATHDGGVWILRLEEKYKDADLFSPITIGNNVHIGLNAMIMPEVNIGNNCIIGSGSIVTKDVPDNSIVAGVPAHIICTTTDYRNKYKSDFDFIKAYDPARKKTYLEEKYTSKWRKNND